MMEIPVNKPAGKIISVQEGDLNNSIENPCFGRN